MAIHCQERPEPSPPTPPPPRPGSPTRNKKASTPAEDDDVPRTSSTSSIPRQIPTIATPHVIRRSPSSVTPPLVLSSSNTSSGSLQPGQEFVEDDVQPRDDRGDGTGELLDVEDEEDDQDDEQFAANSERRQLKYLLCGAVAGAVSRTCTAPLDRLKVLLQTQIAPKPPAGTTNVPPSTLVALRTSLSNLRSASLAIYADGGLRSFWRGNGMNCIKIVPESAIKFYVFEQAKRAVAVFQGCDPDDPETNIGVHGRFVAGGIGGLASQFSIYPIETLKTRVMAVTQAKAAATHAAAMASRAAAAQQASGTSLRGATAVVSSSPSSSSSHTASASGKPAPATSAIPARSFASSSSPAPFTARPPLRPASSSLVLTTAREMWAEGGLRVFFRGLGPSLIGIVPYAGIDLAIYETLKSTYARMHTPLVRDPHLHGPVTPPVMWLLVFGTVSGSVGATAVYPLSLIRTRLQAQGTPGHPERYAGAMDAIRKTYQREGGRGFYKGLAPTLIKVIPAASISYVCYEGMKGVVGL